ncbi:MAG: MMPL family transporter [Deltaproteobacteria bacterium]|nr:MMPL family transporter [Deltaproteobacteria bacterium]
MADAGSTPRTDVHPIVRARWAILLVFAALCAWLIPGVTSLEHDDDVLAFLPPEHPDVVAFHEVADRFGMLEVALVGVRAPAGEDLLTAERAEAVRSLSQALAGLPGVRLVLDYPSLPDLKVEGDTLAVDPLVPKGMADPATIRARVLGSRDAVGNLISADGTAATLLVYLLPPSELRGERAARLDAIRETVAAHWDAEAYFGGAPFVEMTAATSSRSDSQRLSPIVIAVLTVVSAILLGSVTGALLNLVVADIGVALVVGAHGRFGEPFTIVSSTTPVMMVALGGAFGMHLISGYQRQQGDAAARASAALRELWVAVVLSAATTAVAFFALIVMPQVPMRRFGVVTGAGVLGLLLIALLVLPALLSLLPARWLAYKPPRKLPLPFRPPAWLLLALAIGCGWAATRLRADADTRNVFDAHSEPARTDAFFNEHFGGSQFIQIAINADMREPVVLRAIRDLTDQLRIIDGVSDVRSLVEPVEMLTEGFGGRHGLPRDEAQARRVLSNLADHPAMSQLLVPDLEGAIIHVKLAPRSTEALSEITRAVRAVVAAAPAGPLAVGSHDDPEVAADQRRTVEQRVQAQFGVEPETFATLLDPSVAEAAMRTEAARLRDRALLTDEVIEPLTPEEITGVEVEQLLARRGDALRSYLAERLPQLVARDPEGPKYVARELERWLDDARASVRMSAICERLGLAKTDAAAAKPVVPEGLEGLGFDDGPAAVVIAQGSPCGRFADVFSELDDPHWAVPVGAATPPVRTLPWRVQLTGQPLIGEAYAASVTDSLLRSTVVSFLALGLVLLIGRHGRAIVPATWTVLVTMGVIAMLGHPIGVGTSMVSCIAMGAGVDFAIHLSVRARVATSDHPGEEAVDELGGVVVVTGLQLAAAFAVMLASEMPPLRQFGVGLAIGLLLAAAGAVSFAPILHPRRRRDR